MPADPIPQTTTNGWPDTPGVPLNPEENGAHQLTHASDFWQREAATKAAALEAARRENIELERHYREALAEIRNLKDALRKAVPQGKEAW